MKFLKQIIRNKSHYGATTHIGKIRDKNEGYYWIDPDRQL